VSDPTPQPTDPASGQPPPSSPDGPPGGAAGVPGQPGGAQPGAAQPRAETQTSAPDAAEELARADDRIKRALADLDNYRKRAARDIERRVDEERERLLRDWLEAVDSVERALRMDADPKLVEGLRAVLDQMEAILSRHGVQRTGAAGEPFDPERHDAIEVRPTSDVPDRTILEVARSGFARGDRVLRPAQVIVARSPERQP
jgi:molecular chaperone GrpE